jgi:hypothetical protein
MFRYGLIVALICADAHAFTKKEKKAEDLTAATATQSLVWVMKSDGGKSCGEKEGESVESGAAALKKKGVSALESRKLNDGMMRPSVCGASTGMMNLYRIENRDLEKAVSAGFVAAPADFPGLSK